MATAVRRGDRTKGQPKYMNKTAFKHNKNSKKTAMILSIPNVGLCRQCHELIEWKKRYRKYKPLKAVKKCQICSEMTVKFAYHVMCQPCAKQKQVCAKCNKPKEIKQTMEDTVDHSMSIEEVQELLRGYTIKERQRRAIIRTMERGELTCRELKHMMATGTLPEDGGNDDDDNDDNDEEDEEDEEDSAIAESSAVADEKDHAVVSEEATVPTQLPVDVHVERNPVAQADETPETVDAAGPS